MHRASTDALMLNLAYYYYYDYQSARAAPNSRAVSRFSAHYAFQTECEREILPFYKSPYLSYFNVVVEAEEMAEGLDPIAARSVALKELQKKITCAVCRGVYQQALLLSCNHYYCSTCVENMVVRSRGRLFQYPECRQEMILPSRGVAGLQPAFFVERMKDVCSEAEGKVGTLTNVLKSTVTLVSDMASMGDSLV